MMKRFVLGIIILVIIFGPAKVGWSGENSPQSTQTSHQTVEKLMAQLGDDDWNTRETAQKELLDRAGDLLQQYRELKRTIPRENQATANRHIEERREEIREFIRLIREGCRNDDPEVVLRAGQIRSHLYALIQPQIICVDINSGQQLYIMDADGRNRQKITGDALPKDHPACNRDGSKIAFSGGPEGTRDIYVADLVWAPEGWTVKNYVKLTANARDNIHPAWSPDGRRIAFASNREGKYEIYLMDEDGRNQKPLTNAPGGFDDSPAWTPDGQKIAFTTRPNGRQVLEIDTIGPDGRGQIGLLDGIEAMCPDWSPDGKRLTFLSTGKEADDIYIMSAESGGAGRKTVERLTNNAIAIDARLSWSPDGRSIAFVTLRNQHFAVGVVDSAGKDIAVITSTADDNFNTSPVWKPTGLEEFIALLSEVSKK